MRVYFILNFTLSNIGKYYQTKVWLEKEALIAEEEGLNTVGRSSTQTSIYGPDTKMTYSYPRRNIRGVF